MKMIDKVRRGWRDAYWWVMHRVHPTHRYHMVNTGLAPGYYDFDERMLHACFELLCDFVECHGGPDKLDAFSKQLEAEDPSICGHQIKTQREATSLYRWWKNERPANHKRHDEMLMRLYGGVEMITGPVEDKPGLSEILGWSEPKNALPEDNNEALWALEEQNDKDDTDNLIRLMKIRPGLWT